MFGFHTIHSFTVHFTIALFIVSIFYDFWGNLKKDPKFYFIASLNLYAAGVATIFSTISGLLAKKNLQIPVQQLYEFQKHENLALLVVGLVLTLVLWRVGIRGKFPKNYKILYFTLGFIAVISIFICAFYGGVVAHIPDLAFR